MTAALAPNFRASLAAFFLASATFLSTVKLNISDPDTTSINLQLSACFASISLIGNDAEELDEQADSNSIGNVISIFFIYTPVI
jgi:hypothetical protein